MRILFCLDFYYPHVGGGEILFQNLAEGLVQKGHQVTVVTQLVSGAEQYEEHNGVHIHRVNTHNCRYLFPILAFPTMLRHARQTDIVHATTFASAQPAWLASKLAGKPIVLTVHEVWIGKWNTVSDAGFLSNSINDFIERTIYWPNYTKYVAVSHATEKALLNQNIPASKITTIYNGVDYKHWNPTQYINNSIKNELKLNNDNFLFLFTGRSGRSKGLPILLKAFDQLNAPQARLLVIASNSPACRKGYDDALNLAKSLGIMNQVIFMPSVPFARLPYYVLAADCVCIPSLSEGFGFAAAEACAMKRPVIATDNASLPEVVSGKCLLVPPSNVDAFAKAMARAINNDFTTIEERRFLPSQNIEAHQNLYESL